MHINNKFLIKILNFSIIYLILKFFKINKIKKAQVKNVLN